MAKWDAIQEQFPYTETDDIAKTIFALREKEIITWRGSSSSFSHVDDVRLTNLGKIIVGHLKE